MQGRKIPINTISVWIPEPHNANPQKKIKARENIRSQKGSVQLYNANKKTLSLLLKPGIPTLSITHTCSPPRFRTSHAVSVLFCNICYRCFLLLCKLILFCVSLWPVFDGVGLAEFNRANVYLFVWAARPIFVIYCFLFLFFDSMGWYCGAGVFGQIGQGAYHSLSALHYRKIY